MLDFAANDDKFNYRNCPIDWFGYIWEPKMQAILPVRYQVIFYSDNGRAIYYPASSDCSALAEKLKEAKAKGLHSWLSQVN
jgi:hypothetical protein